MCVCVCVCVCACACVRVCVCGIETIIFAIKYMNECIVKWDLSFITF